MKKLIYALVVSFCFTETYAQHYQISNKIPIVGEGGWDYLAVDELNQHLFVSHGTVVQVIDIKTGKLVGTIADTKGVHGIAIDNELNKGFTSNGRDSSVTVFNLKTFEVIDRVNVTAKNPDAILYDSFSKKVFTFNGGSSNCTVIDAVSNKVIGTIALDGKPEFSVTDGNGTIFVNIEDKSCINVINTNLLKVTHHWSIAPGESPSGLAFDKENHRLFSVCENNKMVVIDSESGKIIATVPIGKRCDGVAFDPEKKRVFSSNGEGSITVVQEINPNEFKVLETIETQQGARTIAIDKTTHHLYLPTAEAIKSTTANARPSVKPNSFIILDIEMLK